MSPDTHPNPACMKSFALPARFLLSSVTKLLSEPLKGGMIFFFWLMFSEIAVHGHLPPWVCTEHHGSGIYGGLGPPQEWGRWGASRHCFVSSIYFISPLCQSGEHTCTTWELAAGQWHVLEVGTDWKPVVTRAGDARCRCWDDRKPGCTCWLCL